VISEPVQKKMTSYLAGPSLAAATGSRLDSAAKHIQQCRVSQDHMQTLVNWDGGCNPDELSHNKYRYCVHKDELVLGIGRSWANTIRFQNSTAYPRVLSNLGRLADKDSTSGKYNNAIKMIIYLYHNACTVNDRDRLVNTFKSLDPEVWMTTFQPHGQPQQTYFDVHDSDPDSDIGCKKMVSLLFDFVTVGYANTLGYAHAHNGDTMTSVHIGGLRTVPNGDFEVFCGDMIQWYWPFERLCFTTHGRRKKALVLNGDGGDGGDGQCMFLNSDPWAAPVELDEGGREKNWANKKDAEQRKEFLDRQFGQYKGYEKHIPLIKPYKRDDTHPRIYDWYRVFATAISSARPFEMVDIRISRQAI
jgi:hypothetical protein